MEQRAATQERELGGNWVSNESGVGGFTSGSSLRFYQFCPIFAWSATKKSRVKVNIPDASTNGFQITFGSTRWSSKLELLQCGCCASSPYNGVMAYSRALERLYRQ